MRHFCQIILLFLMTSPVLGQIAHQKITGKITDLKSGEAIIYATVGVKGEPLGTSSNAAGEFDLIVPPELVKNGILKISYIGYHSYEKPISELGNDSIHFIQLRKKDFVLDEVLIMDEKLSVDEILTRAFGGIHDNYPSKPYLLQTFYRHYCKEDTSYGRLIEAAVDIYDPKGHKRFYANPKSKVEVRVNELRRSYDFTKNYDDHDPISLYSTIQYDYTSYESYIHTIPEEFNFKIVDTTFYDKSYVYVINYNVNISEDRKGKTFTNTTSGNIYVSAKDFAILKISESMHNELKGEYESSQMDKDWTVIFKAYDGNYHMSYAMEEGYSKDIKLDNDKKEVSNKDHRFHVEVMTNNVITKNIPTFKGKEPTREELAEVGYSKDFWTTYNVLKNSPLDQKILTDLERRGGELENQFRDN
jgi:hypothetical protein